VKTGEIPRIDDVYEAFKTHARTPQVAAAGVEPLVKEIRDFARYYCRMALKAEADPELKQAFDDLRELKVDVAYPFLMELYHDYVTGHLAKDELLEVVRLVEAYVFRRAICAIPTNSLNKTFSTFSKALKKDRYLESVKAHFLLMPSYRRFPGDDEFKRDVQIRDLYNFRSRSYWLRRFENYGRKERVPVNEYTIEHIMPQSDNLSVAWRTELGEEWERVRETYLHTLGNLTLTGYNSEYSDRPFIEKRDMEGGFRQSPLRVNTGLGELDTWNEDTIRNRASRLAAQAVEVWAAPLVAPDVLNAYRPQVSKPAGYTIQDHPHLLGYPLRDLFAALRNEIVQLDPCVTEEFLKLYVAFKAETNFVDIVPQAKQLVLSLNIAFSDIDDPRGLCKDVSGLGRWGNGDVEVRLSNASDLPYVVGLIRQALEQQLGDGSDG
jgi:predicted transport protein